jgi:hypothetical protein
MIFALADYVRYRLQKGRYNPAVLEAQGWILATPENFAGERTPAPGLGCVVHTQDSFVSWAIMYASRWGPPANHAFILGNGGMIFDVIPTAGVIERPLGDYLDGRSYFLVEPEERRSADDRERSLAWTKTRLGARYAWAQAAHIGSSILYGSDRLDPGHWRLWTDVMIMLAILSVPCRWIRWWPDLFVRIGRRYLRALILNRRPLDVERPSEAFVKAFEPMLSRRGIGVLYQPKWSEIQSIKSRREQGGNP